MLVQCEFYETDGRVTCDVVCEHCGENAYERVTMAKVIEMVRGTSPVLCKECEESKCYVCQKFKVPGMEYSRDGLCPDCERKINALVRTGMFQFGSE